VIFSRLQNLGTKFLLLYNFGFQSMILLFLFALINHSSYLWGRQEMEWEGGGEREGERGEREREERGR
jgi:hypothetical protein